MGSEMCIRDSSLAIFTQYSTLLRLCSGEEHEFLGKVHSFRCKMRPTPPNTSQNTNYSATEMVPASATPGNHQVSFITPLRAVAPLVLASVLTTFGVSPSQSDTFVSVHAQDTVSNLLILFAIPMPVRKSNHII